MSDEAEGSTFHRFPGARSANGGAMVLLFVALGLTVFEGAIRKWLIGSEAGFWSYLAYFSKDLVFASIVLRPAQRVASPPLGVFSEWAIPGALLFLAGAILSCLRGLNPVGALLTLRAGLILPILSLLAARRLVGVRPQPMALLLVICALINCGLGVMQSRLAPDHPWNRYVVADSPVSAVETAVRATGTFSYITGLGVMSSVGVWGGMVLLAFAEKCSAQVTAIVGIVAGFGCGLTSVSRGPILLGSMMLLAWASLSGSGLKVLSRSTVVWVPGVLLIFCAGFFPRFNQLGRAIVERHQTGEDTFSERAFGQLQEGCEAAVRFPFGAGLGTEQVGGNYAATGTMSFSNYETQLPRMIAETGLLGLAGYFAICVGAILALQQARRFATTDEMKAALLATQLLVIPLFYCNVLFNHVASAFVWMIVATMLAATVDCSSRRE